MQALWESPVNTLPNFTEEDKAHVATMKEKGREASGIKKIARRFEGEIQEVCALSRVCVGRSPRNFLSGFVADAWLCCCTCKGAPFTVCVIVTSCLVFEVVHLDTLRSSPSRLFICALQLFCRVPKLSS